MGVKGNRVITRKTGGHRLRAFEYPVNTTYNDRIIMKSQTFLTISME